MNAPSRRALVVGVDVAAVHEDAVLDGDRVQVAGAHADERVARRRGLVLGDVEARRRRRGGRSTRAARTGTGSSSTSSARRCGRTGRRRRGARAGTCRPPARRSSRPAARRSSRAPRARSHRRARSGRRACSPAARSAAKSSSSPARSIASLSGICPAASPRAGTVSDSFPQGAAGLFGSRSSRARSRLSPCSRPRRLPLRLPPVAVLPGESHSAAWAYITEAALRGRAPRAMDDPAAGRVRRRIHRSTRAGRALCPGDERVGVIDQAHRHRPAATPSLRRGEPAVADSSATHVATAVAAIADLAADHEVIVTHGDGPQVGLLATAGRRLRRGCAVPARRAGRRERGPDRLPARPGAGQRARWTDSGDAADTGNRRPRRPGSHDPTKPIGPVFDRATARAARRRARLDVAPDGPLLRRSSRHPTAHVRGARDAAAARRRRRTRRLRGGGGIPFAVDRDGRLLGVAAVIDKDIAAALLARGLGADALLLLTDVPAVQANWGTPQARDLTHATTREPRALSPAEGSMGPKVEAACRFTEATGGIAGIGALADARASLAVSAGRPSRCPALVTVSGARSCRVRSRRRRVTTPCGVAPGARATSRWDTPGAESALTAS